MKGIYVLKHEQRFIAGYTSFSLSKGAKVQVTQIDKDKVLIDFGSRTMDWYDVSFLQKHRIKIQYMKTT